MTRFAFLIFPRVKKICEICFRFELKQLKFEFVDFFFFFTFILYQITFYNNNSRSRSSALITFRLNYLFLRMFQVITTSTMADTFKRQTFFLFIFFFVMEILTGRIFFFFYFLLRYWGN